MIVIIPLGGIGERFKNNGYKKPKALINIFGKPILFYLLDTLNLDKINFVCIPYNNEYADYNFEGTLKVSYPNINFNFIKLNNNTEGAAETLNIAIKSFNCEDCPVLCLDGDNFYTIDIINLWSGKNGIITFEDLGDNEIYSYLDVKDKKILNIIEKQKISNIACCGAYGFSSYKKLFLYTQHILDNKIKQRGEYYTSTVIREMIKDGITFENIEIPLENYHCLGTPIQLKYFYNNYPRISCLNNSERIKKQRICFDLDNTLVTYPKIKDDYSSVEPILKNIKFLKYLKSFGHTIIIYTARRMKTHSGNVGKLLCDIGKITFDTLEKFDIPFDEIYFGKPYADIYIDDLALNCHDNMEKELGYYMDNINPRDFNQIEKNLIEIYTKKSHDLSGEIYYYQNIPHQIKDLFPILLDYDVNNKWYKMEKVQGITVSYLYLNELLNKNTLIHIMNSIKRIHSIEIEIINNELNIYENYSNKLKNRYNSYDYSRFKNYKETFEYLYESLINYEKNNEGKYSVIHGDTVMTNIIINNFGKIKFIDMRGKLGNKLTIYGDYLYDWAKLYQSLIGYDKILLDKNINEAYEKKMIETFETYFIELYSLDQLKKLKLITKSLLFTLIPLHNNELCSKYYDLIYKIII
jgi:capsule biosynthesis phosphatase